MSENPTPEDANRLLDYLLAMETEDSVYSLIKGGFPGFEISVPTSLLTASFEEFERILQRPRLDVERASAVINEAIQLFRRVGLPAHAELLGFQLETIRAIVEELSGASPEYDAAAQSMQESGEAILAPSVEEYSQKSVFAAFLKAREQFRGRSAASYQKLLSDLVAKAESPPSDELINAIVGAHMASTESSDHALARGIWIFKCYSSGDNVRAARHLSRLATVDCREDIDNELYRRTLGQLASHLYQAGHIDESIATYRRALNLPPNILEFRLGYAMLAYDFASLLRMVGRSGESYSVLADLSFHKSQFGVVSERQEVTVLSSRITTLKALVAEDIGRYDEACELFEHLEDAATLLNDTNLEFRARTGIANVMLHQGRIRSSIRAFQQVVDWASSDRRAMHLPSALNNLASAYYSVGRIKDARYEFEYAIQAQGAELNFSVAISLLGIGNCLLDEGDTEGAEAAFAVAGGLAARMGRWRDYTIRTLMNPRSIPGPLEQRVSMVEEVLESSEINDDAMLRLAANEAKANLLREAGRWTEVVKIYESLREQAVEAGSFTNVYRATIALAEAMQFSPTSSQHEIFLLLWDLRRQIESSEHTASKRLYDLLISVLTDDYEGWNLPDERSPIELAFDLHEEYKMRTLLSVPVEAPPERSASIPSSLLEQERILLSEQRKLIARAGDGGGKIERDLRRRARSVEKEISAVRTQIEFFSEGARKLWRTDISALHEVRESMRGEIASTLVSFFVGEEVTTAFTYVPTSDTLRVWRVKVGNAAILAAVQALRSAFNGDMDSYPIVGPIPRKRPWKRNLKALDGLAAQLLGFIDGVESKPHLIVAADGPLRGLPLHALRLNCGYVAESFAVTYVPSATAAVRCLASSDRRVNSSSIYCGGVGAVEDGDRASALERDHEVFESIGISLERHPWHKVDYREIDEALNCQSIVHLTCHGYFDPVDPMRSALLLARDGVRPSTSLSQQSFRQRHHHSLTVRRILGTETQADLITLRACSAGANDAVEGISSIAEAFLSSGARSVVASLWNVDQETSRQFLGDLYRYLLGSNEPRWMALWKCQQAMIHESADTWKTHPYHWAPLVLLGDWR